MRCKTYNQCAFYNNAHCRYAEGILHKKQAFCKDPCYFLPEKKYILEATEEELWKEYLTRRYEKK